MERGIKEGERTEKRSWNEMEGRGEGEERSDP